MLSIKKSIKLIIVSLMLASVGLPALAVDETEGNMPVKVTVEERVTSKVTSIKERVEQKREEIQSRIETRKERIATKAAEVRQRITERKRELVSNHFGRMHKRFQAAITRLELIADRIESRLDKLEEGGLEVAVLREDLEKARANIAVAEGLLEGMELEFEEALASETPKAAYEVIQDTMLEVRDLLKTIHQELVAIIQEIKPGLLDQKQTVESTESASPAI